MASRSERQRRQRQAASEGRGGPRQGTAGKSYTNRSDLNQAPRAAPNQTYGTAGQQIASQQAVPLPGGAPSTQVPSPAQAQAAQLAQRAQSLSPLDAPTQNPSEPLTTGIPQGAGPGPEVLAKGLTPEQLGDADVEGFLRAVAQQYPSSDVERLLAEIALRPKY